MASKNDSTVVDRLFNSAGNSRISIAEMQTAGRSNSSNRRSCSDMPMRVGVVFGETRGEAIVGAKSKRKPTTKRWRFIPDHQTDHR